MAKDKIIRNYGEFKAKADAAAASSKAIKKTKLKKGDISEADVRRRLKEKRVVLPSRKMRQ